MHSSFEEFTKNRRLPRLEIQRDGNYGQMDGCKQALFLMLRRQKRLVDSFL
jgi:hypothetical protein